MRRVILKVEKIGVGRIDSLGKRPGTFTDCAMDFRVTPRFSLASNTRPDSYKKNSSVLRRIDNWLKSQMRRARTLLIYLSWLLTTRRTMPRLIPIGRGGSEDDKSAYPTMLVR